MATEAWNRWPARCSRPPFASSPGPTRHDGLRTTAGLTEERSSCVLDHQMSMIWNTDPVGHCLVFPALQITKSTVVLYLAASASFVNPYPSWLYAAQLTAPPHPRGSRVPRHRGRIPAPLAHDVRSQPPLELARRRKQRPWGSRRRRSFYSSARWRRWWWDFESEYACGAETADRVRRD